MSTIYDFVTLGLFAGLAILFLQRSMEGSRDRMIAYAPPAVACALANWLGNQSYHIPAALTLVAGVAWTVVVLKPFQRDV